MSRRPVRIAFLTSEYPTEVETAGGLATYLQRMARALRDLGHEAEVFTRSEQAPAVLEHEGIRVERVALGRPVASLVPRELLRRTGLWPFEEPYQAWCAARSLARALERRHAARPFDLVQSPDYQSPGLAVACRPPRRHVVRCSWARDLYLATEGSDTTLASRLSERLERRVLRRADRVYAPSRFVAEHLALRHGVEIAVLRPPARVEMAPAAELPPGLPPRYFLHFGLIGALKGSDLVAQALAIAWREEPGLRMVWAGNDWRPGATAALVESLGPARAALTVLGALPRATLHAVLAHALASVLPSRADNCPNTAIESLLCGVGIIAGRGASLDELVEPGRSGELVAMGDAGALARVMVQVWREGAPWLGRGFIAPAVLAEMTPARAVEGLLALALEPRAGGAA